jgi:hypothetical protein
MFYSFLKSFVFFIAYYKKMSLNCDKILLFISFLFLLYVYFHINKIETYQDPLITRIVQDLIKVDPRVKDLSFEASNESFTEDKKRVYLCLKDENGKYYDYNMIMYVCLHELAHAFSNSVDENHTGEEFKENFRKLLKKGEEVGIYNPSLPLNYEYCKK